MTTPRRMTRTRERGKADASAVVRNGNFDLGERIQNIQLGEAQAVL